ncbi:MAG: HAD hydrolase-like protein [Pseudomonadales bacterium]|nr:HAD hydrolase-like protein [Pseudomonadales bacterium]
MAADLFFDLDGTLTDPKIGITRCIQFALEQLGQPAPPMEDLIWCIGPPLIESFRTLVGERCAGTALTRYRERFTETGLYENQVYSGMPQVLDTLRHHGARLHVASSKPLIYVERILNHFELSAYFDTVFGAELDGTRSDKTELLNHALLETGVHPGRAAMIGDRAHDAIGAKNNNMDFIGVLYGYGDEAELRGEGAVHLADSPQSLLNMQPVLKLMSKSDE